MSSSLSGRDRLVFLVWTIRARLCTVALGSLCLASPALFGAPRIKGLHVGRVLGGPLRGGLLAMPTLQRPSFVLGRFEPHVVQAIEEHVLLGGVAYDVGANIGYHTLVMARRVGAAGTVLAFEPSPRDRTVLETNLRINRLDQIQVVPKALAESPGELRFATFGYSGISHLAGEHEPEDATILTVPVTTLDDLIYREGSPPPAFVKIDVEGAELRVLLGGERMLATARPTIVCEVRWSKTFEGVMGLMQRHAYQTRILWRDTIIGDVLCVPNEQAPD